MIRVVAALFCLTLLPRLWTFGQFLDGIIYSSIARNMAEGYGTFWHPYASDLFGKVFYEHPPLSMWFQSLLYRLFGDFPIIDTLWGFLCGTILLYLMNKIHNKVNSGKTGWFAMFLLIIMPMTSWLFSNNMMEAPVTVMAMLATLLQWQGLQKENSTSHLFFILAGLALAMGVLFKNIACLFPLIIPVLYWLFFRSIRFSKAILFSFILVFSTATFLIIILNIGAGMEFYKVYLNRQLLPVIQGNYHEKIDTWRNVYILISELLVPVVISAILILIMSKTEKFKGNAQAGFFLVLGLGATVPLFFIHKFRNFYIYPGLPFYALALAAFANPIPVKINQLISERKSWQKTIMISSIIIMIISIGLFLYGKDKPYRLKEFKHDVVDAKIPIPERSQVGVCNENIRSDYTLEAAFQRYLKVSLVSSGSESPWLLEDKRIPCTIPAQCHLESKSPAIRYNLYFCKN